MKSFIQSISNSLILKNNIWFSRNETNISYPKEGNAQYYMIEEKSFWFKHRNTCIASVVKKYINKKIFFDIGGGNGFVSSELKKNKIDVALVEPGINGILNAKKRGLSNLICSSFQDANFKKSSLPNIGIFDVLEHIQEDERFLDDLNYVLEKNGLLFITVPAYNILWSNEDEQVGHFRRYSLKEIKKKLEEAGFRIQYATYIFFLLPLPIFIHITIPSLFNRRDNNNIEQIQKEHKPNKIFEKILKKEILFIKKDRIIPFGSTCLITAIKV